MLLFSWIYRNTEMMQSLYDIQPNGLTLHNTTNHQTETKWEYKCFLFVWSKIVQLKRREEKKDNRKPKKKE